MLVDAIRFNIRDEGFVSNKIFCIALGILPDGAKEILGIWIDLTESAKFWLRVMNELKTRGLGDILIAVVDGLKGLPEAISAVFPQTVVQPCIVQMIRHARVRVIDGSKARRADGCAPFDWPRTPRPGCRHWKSSRPATGASAIRRPAQWRRKWVHVVPFTALPESRVPDHIHHKRYRGAEPEAAEGSGNHLSNDNTAVKLRNLILDHAAEEWSGRRASGSSARRIWPSTWREVCQPVTNTGLTHELPLIPFFFILRPGWIPSPNLEATSHHAEQQMPRYPE